VAGDKSDDWDGWYRVNIPLADDRFGAHQADIDEGRRAKQRSVRAQRTKKGRAQ
jgi:hypothetical protein